MTTQETCRFPVVLVFAVDWNSEAGPVSWDKPLKPAQMWVSGLLIHEDADTITLAQDYCPDTQGVRETIVITKITIRQRYDFPS